MRSVAALIVVGVVVGTCTLLATNVNAIDRHRHRRTVHARAHAAADTGVPVPVGFGNCGVHLPTADEWKRAVRWGRHARHPEFEEIRALLPVAPAHPLPTPASFVGVVALIRDRVRLFRERTAGTRVSTSVRDAYQRIEQCADQFIAAHINPIMNGAHPEQLITQYRTAIDRISPIINHFPGPHQSLTYDHVAGGLTPCGGVLPACIHDATHTRDEGSRLNVRIITTHAAAMLPNPFMWGFYDTAEIGHPSEVSLALPFRVYSTAAPPQNVPTNPIPAQFLPFAPRECMALRLDATPAPDNVFTTVMDGCDAYVLRHSADAAEPIFIHCNGNSVTSSAYASVPAGTPGCAGEKAKMMTAELLFAKYARHSFVRHVSHRRFPHYGPNPHNGGDALFTFDPAADNVATWGHRRTGHEWDWFASYIGAAEPRPTKPGDPWLYRAQPAPGFTHIQLLRGTPGGGKAPNHAWDAMPHPFGSFRCHERPPTNFEYTAACRSRALCVEFVTERLPGLAPAPNAWWQPPLGMHGGIVPPGIGWNGLPPTAQEAAGIHDVLTRIHAGMTNAAPEAGWSEAKMALHDELRHCLAMLITAAQNG